MSETKLCPLFVMTPQTFHKQNEDCIKGECAWWCKQLQCCALVAIATKGFERSGENE